MEAAAALIALVDKISRIGVAVQGYFQRLSMCDLSLAAEDVVLALCCREHGENKAVELRSCDL